MAKRIDAQGLTTELGPVAGGPATVRLTVRNPTDRPRTFCDYHTPFEGIRNHIFEVRDAAGAEIDYRGIMAKRAPPDDDDFITLAPGETRSAEVDLADAYELPPGRYAVRFIGSDICGLPSSGTVELTVA